MKKWYKLLIYFSLLFILIFLFKNNQLKIPEITNPSYLLFSFLLLFLGFIFDILVWYWLVKKEIPKFSFSIALVSYGLNILTKYIPGKLWVIVGKAAYISNSSNINLIRATSISFLHQIIVVCCGFFIGSFSLLLLFSKTAAFYMMGASFLGLLIIFLYPKIITNTLLFLFSKILKKEYDTILFSQKILLFALISSILCWISWGMGFYFFAISISDITSYIIFSAIFPFATVAGILAIFFPGGLGAREGVLILLIKKCGIDSILAYSIATFSRLWFLIGELLIFITSIFLSLTLKKSIS